MKKISKNIIGSGFIARSFLNQDKYLSLNKICIYASGVSNSSSLNKTQYKKEIIKITSLKNKLDKHTTIIYFSTCSIYDPYRKKKIYNKHKILMEKIIKKEFKNFIIIRLPEVVGKSVNKFTLTNFIYNKITKSIKFQLWSNALRNLIDIKDVVHIVSKIIKIKEFKNCTLNIFNPNMYNVLEIVRCFEKILKKKGNYTLVSSQSSKWKINYSVINNKRISFNYRFKKNYLHKISNKYYAK